MLKKFSGRLYQVNQSIAGAIVLCLFMGQGIVFARDYNVYWPEIFGASQNWVGASSSELSFARYSHLIDSQVSGDPSSQRKWKTITQLIRNQRPENQLRLVHQFFNSLPYKTDLSLHHATDYWASAAEFLRLGGDCEDYAIAKYRALVESGFDPQLLRIVLLEDTITKEPHAVLAALLEGQTFILDNQRAEVLRDSALGHYRPIYAINEIGVWRLQGPLPNPKIDSLVVATQSK